MLKILYKCCCICAYRVKTSLHTTNGAARGNNSRRGSGIRVEHEVMAMIIIIAMFDVILNVELSLLL